MSAEEVKQNQDDNTYEVTLPELDRPLEKMTVKELREIGLLVPTMVGVHSMKKDDLVTQLREVYGIEEEVRTSIAEIKVVKNQIAELRAARTEAQAAGDKQQINMLRRKINRLKKKTRKMAKAAAA